MRKQAMHFYFGLGLSPGSLLFCNCFSSRYKTASLYNGFQTIFRHNGRRNSKKGRKFKLLLFTYIHTYKIKGLEPGICLKYFLSFPQKTCCQRKLRQTKCLLFNFLMIKFTVILPKKAIWHLAIFAKLVFWSILSFKN